jgi:hypothetical protein
MSSHSYRLVLSPRAEQDIESILRYTGETWGERQLIGDSHPPSAYEPGAECMSETIHPYHDGNGRTGRLLMPLILAAEGYPPLYLSGALLRAKSEYYAALASVQLQGEWGPWLELLGHAVVESCDESILIAEDLLALAERWEQELRSYRAHSATRRLPRFLIGQRRSVTNFTFDIS